MSVSELSSGTVSIPTSVILPQEQTTDDVEYKIASSREERANAFHLVYEAYLRAGLGESNAHQMRVTPYHLLTTTEVFLACVGGQAAFTMTLVGDGELGLPIEAVYGPEVQRRRDKGLCVGEVSCLADRRSEFKRSFPVFLRLCRFTAQYAWHIGMHQLLIAVHPRHARFYKRFMDFEPIGEQRSYPTVKNNPAIAMMLDMDRLHRERSESYYTLFAPVIDGKHLKPQPITDEQRNYFSPLVDSSFKFAPLGNESARERSTSDDTLVTTV
ncbi:MAG: hypothetical protein JXM70_09780 [Pirellulales bacterium]|nr:hypothetical protein [Pirellulales bacterium]